MTNRCQGFVLNEGFENLQLAIISIRNNWIEGLITGPLKSNQLDAHFALMKFNALSLSPNVKLIWSKRKKIISFDTLN